MPASQPTSLRLSAEARRLIAELERATGLKRSAVVELALRRLHKAEARKPGQTQPKKGG